MDSQRRAAANRKYVVICRSRAKVGIILKLTTTSWKIPPNSTFPIPQHYSSTVNSHSLHPVIYTFPQKYIWKEKNSMKQNDHQNSIRLINALVITLIISYNLLPFIALLIDTDDTTLHIINLTIRILIQTLQHLSRHLQSRQNHLAKSPSDLSKSPSDLSKSPHKPTTSHTKTAPHPRAKPFLSLSDLRPDITKSGSSLAAW